MEKINACDNLNEIASQHQLMSLFSTPLFIPVKKEQKQNYSIPIHIKNYINTCKKINNNNLACNYNIDFNSKPSIIRTSKSQILKIPSFMCKKFNLKTIKKLKLMKVQNCNNYSKHGTIKNINAKESLGLPNKLFTESISISPQKKVICPNAPRINRNTNIKNNRMNYNNKNSQNIFTNTNNLSNNRNGHVNSNLMSINNNYFSYSNFNSCIMNTTNAHTISNSNSNNSNDSNNTNNRNHYPVRNNNNMIFNGNSVKSINSKSIIKNSKKIRIKRNNNRTASLDLEYKDRNYNNILINDCSLNLKSSLANPKQLMKGFLDSSKTIKTSYSKSILTFDSQKYYIGVSNKPQDANNYLRLKKKFTYSSSQGNIDIFSSIKSIQHKNNNINNNLSNIMNNTNSLFNNCSFNPLNSNNMHSFHNFILNNNINDIRGIHTIINNNNNNNIEETTDSDLNNDDSFSNFNEELNNSNAQNTFPILNALRRLGEEANVVENSNNRENYQSDDDTNFSSDSNLSYNSL